MCMSGSDMRDAHASLCICVYTLHNTSTCNVRLRVWACNASILCVVRIIHVFTHAREQACNVCTCEHVTMHMRYLIPLCEVDAKHLAMSLLMKRNANAVKSICLQLNSCHNIRHLEIAKKVTECDRKTTKTLRGVMSRLIARKHLVCSNYWPSWW